MMSELDLPEVLGIDRAGLIDGLAGSVAAFDTARAGALAVDIPFSSDAVTDVLICGMGGSAVAGDLIASAYYERTRVPLVVHRGYYLPGWAGASTLHLLLSYSGETEETLTAAMQALERESPAIAVTSGGKLDGWYGDHGVPIMRIPSGLQPRMALLHMLIPAVVVLSRLGVIPPQEQELDGARDAIAAAIDAYGPERPTEANPAKQLAIRLADKVPVIYGAEVTSGVAFRWKCQFNENAKQPAFWAALPEMNHNEIMGWEKAGAFGDTAQVVILRDPRQHRQVERRIALTREIIAPHVSDVITIEGEGDTTLARMIDLVLLGDYVTLYAACLRRVDPEPVDSIGRLKAGLASTGNQRLQAGESGSI
ncbi:MAG: bifunctional phosphoglucose/phosphomannose isomerase [Thermoleophilia bacterium]|nr:bifunctional phosphoglucose/phosphomannose isomerase [Thermoleophilia bacterium]